MARAATHHLHPASVDELERALDEVLVGAIDGDFVEVTGMPIPGLAPLTAEDGWWRYAAAVGPSRATLDERHRLALVHPEYDGFLTATVTARTRIDELRLVPDPALEGVVTIHHATGVLERGQVRPVDLELHPGNIPAGGAHGAITVLDGTTVAAPALVLTVATGRRLECTLAGAVDGPWTDAAAFETAVQDLLAGRGSAERLARRIAALESGGADPGWNRLAWRRRRGRA